VADNRNFSPLPAPEAPDPRVAVDRRQRELREGIYALTKAVADHKAEGRFASARADEALIAELRQKLADLTRSGAEEIDPTGG
jgi:hypothetical protein